MAASASKRLRLGGAVAAQQAGGEVDLGAGDPIGVGEQPEGLQRPLQL